LGSFIELVLLGLIQLVTEMITRDVSWGKGGQCTGLTTLPPSCADCLAVLGASTCWSPKDIFWPVLDGFTELVKYFASILYFVFTHVMLMQDAHRILHRFYAVKIYFLVFY
jgi:hypothetical protein